MWRVSLRDLQFRRRRFLIAALATALAFSLTLLLDGVLNHMIHETDHIVDSFEADTWLVAAGGSGPFTTTRFLPAEAADAVRADAGVTAVGPMVQARENIKGKDVNVVGFEPGALGSPPVSEGRLPQASGEVVADRSLSVDVGDTIQLGGQDATVVGETKDLAYYFGGPTVFATVTDVQDRFLGGQRLLSAVALQGSPQEAPAGLRLLDRGEVIDDLNRPAEQGVQTVQVINLLLWLVAGGIVASMVYLSTLERSRDLAVFKAVGVPNRRLYWGLAVQALVLSLGAAAVAVVIALLLRPVFPMPVQIPPSSYVVLAVVAVVLGLLSSLIGLRRTTRTDPALAFGR